jgi:hypothetical protein
MARLPNRKIKRNRGAISAKAARGPLQVVACLLILLPVLQALHFVYLYGVNVIWGDQLNGMYPFFQQWYDGTLGFWDFFRLHNEHRHAFPRFLMFGVGLLTGWNNLAEMYLVVAGLTLNLAMILYVFRRRCRSPHCLWLMVPVAFLVLGVRQYENLLWGVQISLQLPTTAALAAFLCLDLLNDPRRVALKLAGALAAATVATFSAAQGLLVWPVGVVPLLLVPLKRPARVSALTLWITIGAIQWIAYFWSAVASKSPIPLHMSWSYLASIIGASLFPLPDVSLLGGIMIVALTAFAVWVALRQNSGGSCSFWLACIAWAFLISLQTTLGRSGFGLPQALTSRYTTFTLLIVVGVYGILSCVGSEKPGRVITAAWGALFSLIFLGVSLSTLDAYQAGAETRQLREYEAFVFTTSESQPEAVVKGVAGHLASAPQVRDCLEFLKRHHWNVFATSELSERYAPPGPNVTKTFVTVAEPRSQLNIVEEEGVLRAVGWVTDLFGNDNVGGVFLEVDGKFYPAYYGVRCEELVQMLQSDRVRRSGFQRAFLPSQFGKGPHCMTLWALSKDGRSLMATSAPTEFTTRE